MNRLALAFIPACVWSLATSATGCAPLHEGQPAAIGANSDAPKPMCVNASKQLVSSHMTGSLESPVEVQVSEFAVESERHPLTGLSELSVEILVEQVLNRNPSLAQMKAASAAATARFPQVVSLDDPMFAAGFAPASIGSNNVDFGYRFEVSQKFPFPGKRDLRGQSALAEAAAAGNEVDDIRLQLTENAKSSFYDYYLVMRAIAVNEESLRLLQSHREAAKTRYERALVPQQDVFQADVELGRQQERGLILERIRKVAIARINTLMHLPPDASLPPPPAWLTVSDSLPSVETLRALALERRPDLRASRNRIAMEEASLRLAEREYYPDFEALAAYDTLMGNGPMRDLALQVGVRVNLPVQGERRHGAVAEALARVAERRAQLNSRVDQVNLQLQEAYEQLAESEKIVRLYEQTILPAARSNVEAARSAYETGKIPFLSLIEAQRNQVQLLERSYEAIADYFRRKAAMERATGSPISRPE